SRRRHTRSLRDWSSDVCSSDLSSTATVPKSTTGVPAPTPDISLSTTVVDFGTVAVDDDDIQWFTVTNLGDDTLVITDTVQKDSEIGRASCRERAENSKADGA